MKTVFLSGSYYTRIESKAIQEFKEKIKPLDDEETEEILLKDEYIKQNILKAKKAAQLLRDKGYNVFCPHFAIAGYCDDWEDENSEHRKKILEMCAQWIEICDVFAVIPGWQKSDGCRFEYAIAEANNKKIISLTYGQIGV